MQVTLVTPNIGAEVSGIDLAAPLDDTMVLEIRKMFIEHKVLVFRGQH